MNVDNNVNETAVENATEIVIEEQNIVDVTPENTEPADWEVEVEALLPIQRQFIESYAQHCEGEEKMSVDEWLPMELQKNLPEHTPEEVQQMSQEIIEALQTTEDKKQALQEAHKQGRSTESWLDEDIKRSLSYMNEQGVVQYMQNLDDVLVAANEAMHNTVTTNSGLINMNPSLDGFIAERAHVNSFNMDAAAKGSRYYAEVPPLKPGQTYGKNSVDIYIKDNAGNIVQKYQAKYGATAEDTIRMIKAGDYRGQRLLVPAEQVEAVQAAFPNRTVVAEISADGISSTSITKAEVKDMQLDAQSGYSLDADWSSYSTRDITKSICSNAAKAGIMGMAVGAGSEIIGKVLNDEEVDGNEVVAAALTTGADFGVKTATAGALKTAVEKDVITLLPKGTPAATYANIAFVGIENAKTAYKLITGEMDAREAIDEMQTTTASCVGGLAATVPGAGIGAAIGSVFGPVGTAIGGFVGGTIGYIAGSAVGQAVAEVYHTIRDTVFKPVADAVANVVDTVADGVRGFASDVGDFFSSVFSWI